MPLPVPGTFTYQIPGIYVSRCTPGSRVVVQFGKRKIYTGILALIHDQKPDNYTPKEFIDLVDDEPVVTGLQLNYFGWIASYYMCTIGEVINAALPSALKLSSDSYLSINPDIDFDEFELSDKEWTLINHLKSGDIKLNDVGQLVDLKSPYHLVKRLKAQEVIQVFELIKDKYSLKKETRVRLADTFTEEVALGELFDRLQNKEKQTEVILTYLRDIPVLQDFTANAKGLLKKDLVNKVGRSPVDTLIKNGVLSQWEKIISRFAIDNKHEFTPPQLSPAQQQAKDEVMNAFHSHNTVLLKGITGSGKTEIYISLILDILDTGGNVLYLLPEIALTTQIIKRLAAIFGSRFGVYHSRYSDNERAEVWQKVRKGEYKFVVGVRSAVFLPFDDLSLIIVDEEHETSFKQQEPAPRYHARDAAIYLASLFHGKTLLGTATPAVDTYHNALMGKFGLVTLEERFSQVSLPEIEIADLAKERKQKTIRGNFSSRLIQEIKATLSRNKQVILFQNRRGYAPYVSCDNCGYTPSCPHCDVSLTYHIHQNFLICHYCGFKSGMLTECSRCNSTDIRTMSFGTEKVEEELEILIPEARIKRMDLDSTRSKYSYQKIIDDFETGNIDVLIGTQMVSKGLDFDHVQLVGVFDADRMIHFPDFRSHERAFQLIHQVSGRAGRRKETGKVVIQSNDPSQPILALVKRHDYDAFYTSEILEREKFRYPPFCRLIKIIFKDMDKQKASDASRFYAGEIKRHLGEMRVMGPVEPMIGKIKNHYIYELTIKIEKQGIKLSALKELLLTSRNILNGNRFYKSVRVIFDVDPL